MTAATRPWTTLEVRRLRQLWPTAPTVEAVADELGRTVSATREKARALGLPRKVDRARERTHWRDTEDRALEVLSGQGVAMARIASALGRSERACRRRLAEIRSTER